MFSRCANAFWRSIDGADGLDARGERTRNYYLYLYGLPMKLRDSGAHLAPQAKETTFEGRPVHELKVTYDAEVGTDRWYFYLDRSLFEVLDFHL